ncbi:MULTISPECIES: hypothetical protein [Rhodanobacter]|uniref:Uncharacterized protein n=3 Tax=Rhodanobacter TaxID=75309 RepID=A0A154QIX1_9GAMM|nr:MULTISPECIES: hypothetical protein [Rhodanobacter]AGG89544.1 hypothetical protein R2APBS1_2455 [Rhodanobacter denitrificans]EIM03930.1 hypothetical protein UUC_05286 [Rhodanobacter denitrificans]KZC20558.1 hypothetical protein RHOFW104R3_25070 [Rhodanobacter denitrificans]KZC24114.1 hypothetical protein RHOFW104T7_10360 [Rhodanobacter thiooxydans]UJJ49742.1 hypothetical protein LRK52_10910 [Rhodanobacter denitrificans]
MSDVVEFLERMGKDAQLSRASGNKLEQVAASAGLDLILQDAILSEDSSTLKALLGIATHCAMLAPAEEQEEQEDEGGNETPEREGETSRAALSAVELIG